jgi:hypothetical protein
MCGAPQPEQPTESGKRKRGKNDFFFFFSLFFFSLSARHTRRSMRAGTNKKPTTAQWEQKNANQSNFLFFFCLNVFQEIFRWVRRGDVTG